MMEESKPQSREPEVRSGQGLNRMWMALISSYAKALASIYGIKGWTQPAPVILSIGPIQKAETKKP